MSHAVLLNIDAGEHDDEAEELYAAADIVHVACGGHAGDAASMDRVVRACARLGTRVGAHPSYVDREGFGRRAQEIEPSMLAAQVEAQCRALRRVTSEGGATIQSAKLHGALYHRANVDAAVARACVDGIVKALGPVAVVGIADGALEAATLAAGLPFLREAFADRGVHDDGSLIARGESGALIDDPDAAARRAAALAQDPRVDTICIHGDTPNAVLIARAVRAVLGPRSREASGSSGSGGL